jgi:hypothetical protein
MNRLMSRLRVESREIGVGHWLLMVDTDGVVAIPQMTRF